MIDILAAIGAAVSVIFTAGGLYFSFRRQQRDLNGIGRKVGTQEQTATRRYQRITLALLKICKEDARDFLTEFLKED